MDRFCEHTDVLTKSALDGHSSPCAAQPSSSAQISSISDSVADLLICCGRERRNMAWRSGTPPC